MTTPDAEVLIEQIRVFTDVLRRIEHHAPTLTDVQTLAGEALYDMDVRVAAQLNAVPINDVADVLRYLAAIRTWVQDHRRTLSPAEANAVQEASSWLAQDADITQAVAWEETYDTAKVHKESLIFCQQRVAAALQKLQLQLDQYDTFADNVHEAPS